MKKKIEPLSPEAIKYESFKKQIKDRIKSVGLRAIQMECDYLKTRPDMEVGGLCNSDAVACYTSTIGNHADALRLKRLAKSNIKI
jgi:hypothetical protein